MNDTTPAIAEKMRELIRQKTPTERLEMGLSMNETSRGLIIRSILNENPDISKAEMRVELFLKFYNGDFDEPTKQRIIKHLREIESIDP